MPASPDPDVRLWIGPSAVHLEPALELALGLPPVRAERRVFPDGEVCVRVPDEPASGTTVVIVQGTHPPQDRHLQELYQLVDVAVAGGAGRVLCVVPYLAYARQDRRHAPGEPASCAIVLSTLAALGASALAAVDVHSPDALRGGAPRATSLATDSLFAGWVAGLDLADPVLVSPDAGGRSRASAVARRIGADVRVCAKSKDASGRTLYREPPPDLDGRDVLAIDDLCSSGSTLLPLAEHLREGGARRLFYGVSHFFADGDRLAREAALPTVVAGTDTIPTEWSALSVAPLLADWIRSAIRARPARSASSVARVAAPGPSS